MKDETRNVNLNHLNRGHSLTPRSTAHIYNVPELETHDLLDCSCGDRFWLTKGALK